MTRTTIWDKCQTDVPGILVDCSFVVHVQMLCDTLMRSECPMFALWRVKGRWFWSSAEDPIRIRESPSIRRCITGD
jgi:hypothetical protein